MRKSIVAAALAVTLGTAGAAAAQSAEGASLTLVAAGPSQLIQDGAAWRCDGPECRAARVRSLPALHACKRIVGEVGAVRAFTWRGKSLDEAGLAACNAAAKG